MGGHGSGRLNKTDAFLKKNSNPFKTVSGNLASIGNEVLVVPNHSGDHSAGTTGTPASNLDIANKKYVDDSIITPIWVEKAGDTMTGTLVIKSGGTALDIQDNAGNQKIFTNINGGFSELSLTNSSHVKKIFLATGQDCFIDGVDLLIGGTTNATAPINLNNNGSVKITGALSGGGSGHDQFSDFDTNKHFDTSTLTSGSIPFSNGTTFLEDNTNLKWDNTTKQLILAKIDDVTKPILAFGDGTTGWYQNLDDTLKLAVNGVVVLTINEGGIIFGATVDRPRVANELTTTTNPTLIPVATDSDTGIGGTIGDHLSLIAGGVEMISIIENVFSDNIISMNDRVGIGIANPTAKTHIDQSSTSAAIPVLFLDQADLSEEMIEFNTTIGTGNAIEAVAAKTLTTTHFIKVNINGTILYLQAGTIA